MASKKYKAFATGKIMLFGEHSVVYGYPCIVAAVNKKITVESYLDNYPQDKIKSQFNDTRFVCRAIELFKEEFAIKENITVNITSDIFNYGLGLSSAVTVATIKSLTQLFDIKLTNKQIFDLSYKVVLDIQKVGSGFDIASAIWGDIIYYKNFGEIIKPINNPGLNLVVGYSGVKANTVEMILL